jgi:RNA polymerase sigma-70 factor (ECF subfamily)
MADTVSNLDAIRRAFERLSAAERTILVLHHVEQRSIAEIAPLLGVAPGTVKWRLHEARRALQHALEGEDR